jgi:hypothetical protein
LFSPSCRERLDLFDADNERNLAEYEGRSDIDKRLLADLIRCTKKMEAAVDKLDPPKDRE